MTIQEIEVALEEGGLGGCGLQGLAVVQREPGGAVAWLRALCSSGWRRVRGEVLRIGIGRRLGWARLPSNRFAIATRAGAAPATVRFQGRGRGHGVGLCLRGALGRARAGWDEAVIFILGYYFPNIELLRAEGAR